MTGPQSSFDEVLKIMQQYYAGVVAANFVDFTTIIILLCVKSVMRVVADFFVA